MKRTILKLNQHNQYLLPVLAVCLLIFSFSAVGGDVQTVLAQSGTCSWNGNVYSAGEIFLNQSGQQYLCNSDGTISYIGITPSYPAYPNPAPDLNYSSYPLGYYGYYSESPNVLISSLYSTYSSSATSLSALYAGYLGTISLSPVTTYESANPADIAEPVAAPAPAPPQNLVTTINYPMLEYYEQTCSWHGIVYTPGQKFCNSACQEYVCNSDGSIVWTGLETTETTVAPTCPYCIHYVEATSTN